MRTLRLLLIFLILIAVKPALAVTPYLVRDINPEAEPAGSEPRDVVSLGDLALFKAGSFSGTALWRSDGTAAGTYALLEAGRIELLALTEDLCFFLAYEPGRFLPHVWVTNGSAAGTFRLLETTLEMSDAPSRAAWVPEQRALYFAAGLGGGIELWRTDGTPGGTYEVADIWPGSNGSSPSELTSFKGKVHFVAADPARGLALWRSDGTAQGTVRVRDTEPGSSEHGPSLLQVVGSRLIFLGRDLAHGAELWSSDGTTKGTRLVTDLVKGPGSPTFYDFAVHGQRLYFVATDSSARAQELWVTDGTAKGSQVLTNFTNPTAFQDLLLSQTSLGGRMIFVANDGPHGAELWSTDGRAKGTRLVLDLCPGPCSGAFSFPVLHKGRLYFPGTNGVRGAELWVTDGSAKGTRLVRDLCRGSCSSGPSRLLSVGSHLFFMAYNGTRILLWATDGTARRTMPLTQPDVTFWKGFDGAAAGPMLVFAASDPEHGREIWCSDGTPGGTFLLADIAEGDLGGSYPGNLMTLGGTVLFFADDGQHGYELWKSDGTATGTTLVAELQPGVMPIETPFVESWAASGNRVFFRLRGFLDEPALWTSDGTAAGTFRLTSLGVLVSSEAVLPVGPQVFFLADDMEHGLEPWITDGTVEGTRMLADIAPGSDSSGPRELTAFQGRLWFVASTPSGSNRLWRSDGTTAGTVQVGPELGWIRSLVVHGGRLWFMGQDEEHGLELWSSDGTTGGTALKVELIPGPASFFPRLMFSDGVRLYLSGQPESELPGLWVSDGTTAGTRKISTAYVLDEWALFGGRLYYNGFSPPEHELHVSDGTAEGTQPLRTADGQPLLLVKDLLPFGRWLLMVANGLELWQTDGTEAGTMLVRDLSPLPYNPPRLIRAGSHVFFRAWDPETGWELWAVQE